MKNKNLPLILVGLLTVVVIIWFSIKNNKHDPQAKKTIYVAAILPLSGENALYGENDKKGIELALKNYQSDSIEIKVLYEDNKGTPKDAAIAVQKIGNENCIAIIDDAISTITFSIIPTAENKKIPIISTGATNPKLSGISPYFFRIWNSDIEEGAFAASSAKNELGKNTVSVIYLNTDYGIGLKEVFVKKFKELGGTVKSETSFDESEKNFKNIINKTDFTAELIYLIGYGNQTGLIVRNIREQRKNNIILSTVATEDKQFLEKAGKFGDGIVYVYNAQVTNEEYVRFNEKYFAMYNSQPQILNDVGYDAMNIILNAIKSGVRSGESFKNYLREMGTHEGASGNIKFDENGDVHKNMILKTILGDKFIEFKENG